MNAITVVGRTFLSNACEPLAETPDKNVRPTKEFVPSHTVEGGPGSVVFIEVCHAFSSSPPVHAVPLVVSASPILSVAVMRAESAGEGRSGRATTFGRVVVGLRRSE